jgi:hydroxymethylbilane synthase
MPLLLQPEGLQAHVRLRLHEQGRRRRNRAPLRGGVVLRRVLGLQLRRVRALMAARLRIGTRGSQLALWQANWVKTAVEGHHPGARVELVTIKTQGDRILDVPLAQVGGKGLFVKEIEEALLDGRVDLAVHSLKDMPAGLPPGLHIAAVPRREDPRDVLIARTAKRFDDLPPAARIGTSSLRRAAQILHARPDMTIVPLRGNLDTRLRKLASEALDAIVLAAAGIHRLGWAGRISAYLEPDFMLPAVGQGALCLEARRDDPAVAALIAPLEHPATRQAVAAERAFLQRLEGGCQVPIAGYATVAGDRLVLTGLVADPSGAPLHRQSLEGATAAAEALGLQLAEALLARGAGIILNQLQRRGQPS